MVQGQCFLEAAVAMAFERRLCNLVGGRKAMLAVTTVCSVAVALLFIIVFKRRLVAFERQ